jgi:cell division protease FtsH
METEDTVTEVDDEGEEQEEVTAGFISRLSDRHQRLGEKNKAVSDAFLGVGERAHDTGIVPKYYGELLTWALKRYMERENWQVVQTLGYRGTEPVYLDVSTGCNQRENLLMNGQLLLKNDVTCLIVTVDINLRWRNSILVEGPADRKQQIREFVVGVMETAHTNNFYRGRQIQYAGRIRFLDVKARSWDSIILDDDAKAEIQANTIGFLRRAHLWEKYGIPSKRGVLLAGDPGTGKTIICKALMAEAEGITCITTNGYSLDEDDYLTDLYELAGDLSPCIVFIEDIDLIGQNRHEFGYQRGNALLSLLAVLDGIEEKKEIVTVATTNCLDMLDKALSQRPSRFDRVIKLSRPTAPQRHELVSRLCRKIPFDEETQTYIAAHSEGCTPAQLQEIVNSLVIERVAASGKDLPEMTFSKGDLKQLIARINSGRQSRVGFILPDYRAAGTTDNVNQEDRR